MSIALSDIATLKENHRLDDIAFLHKIGALGRAETSELKPTLAGLIMFALLDIGERAGSGLHSIRTVWEDMKWEAPVMTEQINPDRTIWHVPVELEEDNVGINDADVGLNSENVGLNFLLELIEKYPGERANFFRENYKIPVTMRTVERWLKTLRDEKKIEFRGSKKNGGYWLIERM
jgi:predicted HTH transcriptional regulator